VFKPERWMHLLQPQQQQQQSSHVNAAQQPQVQTQAGGCPLSSSDASAQQQQVQAQGDSGACPYGSSSSTGSNSGSSSSSAAPAGYSFSSVLRELGPNGAFVPFGGGPRNCIGTGFAMTEAVLVLALLLQRYELHPVSPAAGFPRPKPMLTLRPEAVNLRVTARQQQQANKPAQHQQQGPAVAAARAPVGA
jgi:hypothetical protein